MTRTKAKEKSVYCTDRSLHSSAAQSGFKPKFHFKSGNVSLGNVTVMASKDHTSYDTFEYMKHSAAEYMKHCAVRVQGAGMCSLGPGKQ